MLGRLSFAAGVEMTRAFFVVALMFVLAGCNARTRNEGGHPIIGADSGATDASADAGANDAANNGDASSLVDSDHDSVPDAVEIGPDPAHPLDSDHDGTPDYLDTDSDNDTISDLDESLPVGPPWPDTDGDGTVDRLDLDSDNDTLLDSREAGDTNLGTYPVDSDMDGIPDFRDPDSDNDGLSDTAEVAAGTDPTKADTDMDGVPDLVEVQGCPAGEVDCAHDATNASSSPLTHGNFVFVMPYNSAPTPPVETLDFQTSIQKADIYFLMDNTGSMSGTVSALQAGLVATVIPTARTMIPDAWFGVGGFDDYPIQDTGGGTYAHGTPNVRTDSDGIVHDSPFFQYATMTDPAAAGGMTALQNAVNVYGVNDGFDGPESGLAALYALATGNTLSGYARFPGTSPPTCTAGRSGVACFRNDAVPIVVMMTDVDQHNSPTCTADSSCMYGSEIPGGAPTWANTISALMMRNIRVVGIDTSGSNGPHAFYSSLVQSTTIALLPSGSTGPSTVAGTYIINAPGGSGLTSSVASAIEAAAIAPINVSVKAVPVMNPGDTVDAVASFIDFVETRTSHDPTHPDCITDLNVSYSSGLNTFGPPGMPYGYNNTFDTVPPGDHVCFDVHSKMNTTVPATRAGQLFRAQLNVLGDGFTPLDSRQVFFLVPALIAISSVPG